MRINSETEMLEVGNKLGREILHGFLEHPQVIELIGDVGAGKTTLTRGLARGLGVKEPVTSPSFTISRSYAFPVDAERGKDRKMDQSGAQNINQSRTREAELVHYDFYRLDDPGLLAEDLAEALSDPNRVVVIEWGGSVASLLPEKRLTLRITLNDDGTRELELLGDCDDAHRLEFLGNREAALKETF